MGAVDTVQSIFCIPGNIKQQYLPWVLNPKAAINQTVFSSNDLDKPNVAPQYFSFRYVKSRDAGSAQLGIFPQSFLKLMKTDIGNRLLPTYNSNYKGDQVNLDAFLKAIPGIQIREFLPDTRLDQMLNIFANIISGIAKLFNESKKSSSKQTTDKKQSIQSTDNKRKTFNDYVNDVTQKFSALKEGALEAGGDIIKCVWHAFNYLTGTLQPNNLYTNANIGIKNEIGKYSNGGELAGSIQEKQILQFPYTLYYRMQSCVTTNIYELPFAGKTLYTSSGSKGWGTSNSIAFEDPTSKIPIVGGLLKKWSGAASVLDVMQNIRISMMPWWDTKNGGQATPEIEVKFDLFNDTNESAMANFIFVNTLIPNNKAIQYGLMQHSPCLYDIKLEGFNRLFACSGDFTVNYKGVLRDPHPLWVKELISKHKNKNLKFSADLVSARLIKIPDIYEVTMKFTSILPADFNGFLYSYVANNNIISDYDNTARDDGIMATVVTAATTDLFAEMKAYIKAEGYEKEGADTGSYV